jgi:AbrB family looped-hinge helix DNA binding protein
MLVVTIMPSTNLIKAHKLKSDGTLAVVIPKEIREELDIEKGSLFKVTKDAKGRLIYKKIF